MKNIKENIKKYPIFIYLALQTILFQIIGVIALKKNNHPDIKHLFIYMDIAVILSVFSFFIHKILNTKYKKLVNIIDFISVLFVLYSLLPFYKYVPMPIP